MTQLKWYVTPGDVPVGRSTCSVAFNDAYRMVSASLHALRRLPELHGGYRSRGTKKVLLMGANAVGPEKWPLCANIQGAAGLNRVYAFCKSICE